MMQTERTRTGVHFETLGCRLNQIESESAARGFSDAGFETDITPYTAAEPLKPHIVLCVINTCTVTAKADQKARRLIRMLLKICPNAAILATGCYAELEEHAIGAMNKRIAVLKGSRKDLLAELPKQLQNIIDDGNSANCIQPEQTAAALRRYISDKSDNIERFALSTDTFMRHSRASLKIQDGCDNSCAYCRIHIARGKSISLQPEEIARRVQKLEHQHYTEVSLTGVNVSQYEGTLPDGTAADFTELIAYILRTTKNIAVRLSSLHPDYIDSRFCELIKNPRIRPYFHLSVQSGSNSVLAAMNRRYCAEQVQNAVSNLRAAKPDSFISCDIITGFPGETETDFCATETLCRNCSFAWIHVFPFSPRPGTAAFGMNAQIPPETARRRAKKLTQLAKQQKRQFIQQHIGNAVPATIEKRSLDSRRNSNEIHGVCGNFLHVRISCRNFPPEQLRQLEGTEVSVIITEISNSPDYDAEARLA